MSRVTSFQERIIDHTYVFSWRFSPRSRSWHYNLTGPHPLRSPISRLFYRIKIYLAVSPCWHINGDILIGTQGEAQKLCGFGICDCSKHWTRCSILGSVCLTKIGQRPKTDLKETLDRPRRDLRETLPKWQMAMTIGKYGNVIFGYFCMYRHILGV